MQFTEPELKVLINAVNITKSCTRAILPDIAFVLCSDDTHFKNGLDGVDLIYRIKEMSLEEIADLYSKVEAFWNVPDYYTQDTRMRLIEVGLLKEDSAVVAI